MSRRNCIVPRAESTRHRALQLAPCMSIFAFDEELLVDDTPLASLPQPHHGARRRSSVYRRLSVRLALVNIGIPELSSEKRKIADFEPLKVLGLGAYGKVHLVRDRRNGLLYAQKQIRKPAIDVLERAAPVQRTLAERQILLQIAHHNNIVKLFYALHDVDKCYLMMEYISGGELFHHLTTENKLGNVFKEDDVAFYGAQMAMGLRHLHTLGIVYRDLKPENCLLNAKGHLVLTDFGLSKAIGDASDGCTLIIGTPEYMAPEIVKGEAYDYAVDWWLLGCVLYDMMTGKPPFSGKTHLQITDKIIKAKAVMPFYLLADAKALLTQLLQKNPARRLNADSEWGKFCALRFFRKINWEALAAQDESVVPPIVPKISDPALAENFSADFTSLKISDYDLGTGQHVGDDVFAGFSYAASHSYIDRFAATIETTNE